LIRTACTKLPMVSCASYVHLPCTSFSVSVVNSVRPSFRGAQRPRQLWLCTTRLWQCGRRSLLIPSVDARVWLDRKQMLRPLNGPCASPRSVMLTAICLSLDIILGQSQGSGRLSSVALTHPSVPALTRCGTQSSAVATTRSRYQRLLPASVSSANNST